MRPVGIQPFQEDFKSLVEQRLEILPQTAGKGRRDPAGADGDPQGSPGHERGHGDGRIVRLVGGAEQKPLLLGQIEQIAATKTYRVAANVASGDTQGVFQLVSEPLLVPLTREDTSQDYTIIVGFDGAGGGTLERAPAKPKRR